MKLNHVVTGLYGMNSRMLPMADTAIVMKRKVLGFIFLRMIPPRNLPMNKAIISTILPVEGAMFAFADSIDGILPNMEASAPQ